MSDRSHAAFDERLLRDVNAQAVRYGGPAAIAARARSPTETGPQSAFTADDGSKIYAPRCHGLRFGPAAGPTRTRQALDMRHRRESGLLSVCGPTAGAVVAAVVQASRSRCVRRASVTAQVQLLKRQNGTTVSYSTSGVTEFVHCILRPGMGPTHREEAFHVIRLLGSS
jgi:hypothetical protein